MKSAIRLDENVIGGRSLLDVKDSVRYVYWNLEDLDKIEKTNLSLYNRFMMVVDRNLVKKLRLSAQAYAAV